MTRRIKQKPSLFAPAGNFIRRLSNENARIRRRLVMIGALLVVVLLIYSIASDTYGVLRIVKLEMEKRALQEANLRQTADLIDAARELDLLKSDRSYIEFIARTQYHMARPNETIFRFRSR
ncbi:MAG: septum formation initiator family protein [Candidatus Zixiibacteriota bacterium]